MILNGPTRWGILAGVPIVMTAGLFCLGVVRPVFEAHSTLSLTTGPASLGEELRHVQLASIQQEVTALQKMSAPVLRIDRTQNPAEIRITAQGYGRTGIRDAAQSAAQRVMEGSLTRQKADLVQSETAVQVKAVSLNNKLVTLIHERENTVAALHRRLKFGVNRRKKAGLPASDLVTTISRQIVEIQLQEAMLLQQEQALIQHQRGIKSAWRLSHAAQTPTWPLRVQGGILSSILILLSFSLSFWLLKIRREETSVAIPFSPTPLEIVSPQEETLLPDDPLTLQAATLYQAWLDLAKILYKPAPEPPQGFFEQVGPVLQETTTFFSQSPDVMTRYLAQATTTAHDLPTHVARTVLMVLLASHDAGASIEHSVGLAMAALFHDLAVVPRADADWADIGAEVGRLSAALLQKIPGLAPSVLRMSQDILIGMDEYPMNVWQNIPRSEALESFSKLLRHTDRFEKVMQKQKIRLTRRLNQRAS